MMTDSGAPGPAPDGTIWNRKLRRFRPFSDGDPIIDGDVMHRSVMVMDSVQQAVAAAPTTGGRQAMDYRQQVVARKVLGDAYPRDLAGLDVRRLALSKFFSDYDPLTPTEKLDQLFTAMAAMMDAGITCGAIHAGANTHGTISQPVEDARNGMIADISTAWMSPEQRKAAGIGEQGA